MERLCYMNTTNLPPPLTPRTSPTLPSLHPSTRFCQCNQQRNIISPVLVQPYYKQSTLVLIQIHLPPEMDMVHVEPINRNCFRDSFRAMADVMYEGISTIPTASVDDHWATWHKFCGAVDLKLSNHLLSRYVTHSS